MGALKLAYRTTKPTLKVVHSNLYENKNNCTGAYRYGFNDQEKDEEVAGTGNSYTAEFWQYDSRLGRRWNLDTEFKRVPGWTPYHINFMNPIWFNDPKGDMPTAKEKF